MRKLDAVVLSGLGGAALGLYLLINSIGGAPQAASRPASAPAAKVQPAPITSSKPEEKAPVKQTAKAVAKPTVATALSQSLEQRCCENDACYRNIGPVTVQGELDGKRIKQLIYASMAQSYGLSQNDELHFTLPAITEKQQADGYKVQWVRSPRLKESITYHMVSAHPIQERAVVGLYKGESLCASYPISIDIRADDAVVSQSDPEKAPAESQRSRAAPSLERTVASPLESTVAVPPESKIPALSDIRIVSEPVAQPAYSGIMIQSAEGAVRYEDLPVSKDTTQRVYAIPDQRTQKEALSALPAQNRALKEILLWVPWDTTSYVAQK